MGVFTCCHSALLLPGVKESAFVITPGQREATRKNVDNKDSFVLSLLLALAYILQVGLLANGSVGRSDPMVP